MEQRVRLLEQSVHRLASMVGRAASPAPVPAPLPLPPARTRRCHRQMRGPTRCLETLAMRCSASVIGGWASATSNNGFGCKIGFAALVRFSKQDGYDRTASLLWHGTPKHSTSMVNAFMSGCHVAVANNPHDTSWAYRSTLVARPLESSGWGELSHDTA